MQKMKFKHTLNNLFDSEAESEKDAEIAISVQGFLDDPELVGNFRLGHPGDGVRVRSAHGSMDAIRNNAVPANKRDQILKAQLWMEQDDLLEKLISTKIDFTSTGFNLRCKPPEGTALQKLLSSVKFPVGEDGEDDERSEESTNGEANGEVIDSIPPTRSPLNLISQKEADLLIQTVEFQQLLNNLSQKWDFEGLVDDLLRDWYVTDSMILYWKVEQGEGPQLDSDSSTPMVRDKQDLLPKVTNICALNPADVDWDNSLGIEKLSIKISVALKRRIQTAIDLDRELAKRQQPKRFVKELEKDGVGKKWIDAVKSKQDMVELKNEDGEFWVIKTKARKQHGLASPSMKNIFLPLETRKMLREGDFGAAFMMKHFIFHVKAGESIQSGPLAGQRKNWAKKKDTDELLNLISTTSKSSRISTNHTVKFEFIFPPKEMFDDEKYFKVELMMFVWAGVTLAIMTGGGQEQKAATGFIGIKRMVANIVKTRRAINWMLTEFFDHETIRSLVNPPDNCRVIASFDENILKEPKQLLDEIKLLVQEGVEDVRTAARELGRDPDALALGKLYTIAENEQTAVWEPIMKKPGQQDFNGGRPPNDNTTQTEDTRTQFTGNR